MQVSSMGQVRVLEDAYGIEKAQLVRESYAYKREKREPGSEIFRLPLGVNLV
jgi:hypothetical protein